MFTKIHLKSDVSSGDKAASNRVEAVEFGTGRRMQGLKEGRTASSVRKKEGWGYSHGDDRDPKFSPSSQLDSDCFSKKTNGNISRKFA